jgi:hypothetical protein
MSLLQNCLGKKCLEWRHAWWCKICTKVVGKENLFVPKFNSFSKHVGRKKITSPMFGVSKSTFYYINDCQHAKKNCIMFLKVGKVFWIGLYKVWQMRVWKKSFNLPQNLLRKESPCLNMKSWKTSCNSFKWKTIRRNVDNLS